MIQELTWCPPGPPAMPIVPPHYCPGRAVTCPNCGRLIYPLPQPPPWPNYQVQPIWYTGTTIVTC